MNPTTLNSFISRRDMLKRTAAGERTRAEHHAQLLLVSNEMWHVD